jgi:O-antigen/teichoic acid export membrane protein
VGAASEPLATPAASDVVAAPAARTIATRILRASTVYGIANLGIRALNFLLLPVYTRYLSPSDYGIIALAETLAAFSVQVVGMGFDASIQRLYFRHIDEPEELASYVGSGLKFALALEAIFVALTLTLGPWLQHTIAPGSSVRYSFLAMAMITVAATQFFGYRLVLYQSEHRPWPYAILSLLSFALTASTSVALVVFARRGVLGMLGGKLFAAAVCLAIAIFLTRHEFRSRFHWAYVRETVRIGLPLVPHQLMALGLITADRFILAHYRDLREVGLYSIAYTFGMIMSLVTMSLNQAWAPVYYDVARKGEEGRRILGKMCDGLVVILTAVACFGSLIAQPFIAHFLDHRYVAAGRVVPWIIGSYLAHSLFSMFGLAAMQAQRTKLIMGSSFIALVVNTILNFALIPHWGMYGAGCATLIAYVVEALVMYRLAQQAHRLHYDLPCIFAAMAIFAGVLVVTQIHWSASQQVMFTILAAVVSLGLLATLGVKRAGFMLPSAAARSQLT